MTVDEPDPALLQLFTKIARDRGFDCTAYKQGCLRRRVGVRMRARGVHTYEAYAGLLDEDASEYDRLLDALTINVTKFYRNRETWDTLASGVVPEITSRREGSVRAWSAGCASGEEPYTMAILLLEAARAAGQPGRPRVDATDIDRGSLARAAHGAYGASALEEMPPDLVRRYFTSEEPRCVVPDARVLVQFRHHDLLREPPPAPPYDLIVCRNVVIYFDRPTQERLFLQFADALSATGVLVLGKVETLFGAARERLVLEDTRERIYRKA